jgi:cell division protein FtsW (lipid II flippase)
MGLAYLAAAGAPSRYLIVNLAALVLGASLWLALGRAAGGRLRLSGLMIAGLAAALVLTAFFGLAVDGAARWVSVGPLSMQVSLVLLPVMLILYARRPDAVGTAGMAAAAFALAVQPDRAMAGVLAAGLLALVLAKPGRLPLVAAGAAIAAFGWTMLTPDALSAVPWVDHVLYTAFDVHPLAGLAVATGAAALALPALAASRGGSDARPALLAFGAFWLAVVIAAALGNYPTPLVGYGGSAILGYLLSGALLPADALAASARHASSTQSGADPGADQAGPELRTAHPA